MYYLLYGLLYPVSLLPLFILYRLSDLVSFLLYHVFGYRKDVVMNNLLIAFPEKSEAERKKIAREFYKGLIDSFIESIKMLSMSTREFERRCTSNYHVLDELIAQGKSIQLHMGHQMNWEFVNWTFSKCLSIPFVGIYQQISNDAVNRLFIKIRSRYKTELVSTKEFRTKAHILFRRQYSIGLVADQNTPHGDTAKWMYFFSKPVPFITGPEKGAMKNKTAVVFVNSVKRKRGHYHLDMTIITPEATGYKEGELTRMYRDFLEEKIRLQPTNYLWSHRRWRHDYFPHYAHNWIDDRPLP